MKALVVVLIVIPICWFLYGGIMCFLGHAERQGLVIGEGGEVPRIREKLLRQQRTLGRLGGRMMRWWAIPVLMFGAGVALWAVFRPN